MPKTRAQHLRANATPHEWKLWQVLRRRSVEGYRFRQQVPLGPYVVDFCCHQLGLIIEADGSQHSESEHDDIRDAWLRSRGYEILRIWNSDIAKNFEGVMLTIMGAIERREARLQLSRDSRTKLPPP